MRILITMLAAWLLPMCLCACLPAEERPEPGKVELRVALDSDNEQVITDDGFRIHFEQAYVGIGNAQLEPAEPGAECRQYASTPYLRVVDLLAGPTRLATLFARGPCELRFEALGPGEVEPVVSDLEDDVLSALEAKGSDPFVREQSAVLRVAGRAERGSEQLRFSWSFRQGFAVDPCATAAFEPGESELVVIRARLAKLFADPSDGLSRFEPMAAADRAGNADGEVTLDELHARALARQLYLEVVPRLFWIGDDPPCFVGEVRVGPPPPPR